VTYEAFVAWFPRLALGKLRHSLEAADADAVATWSDEVRRRVDEIEARTAELEDWGTVRARLEATRQT